MYARYGGPSCSDFVASSSALMTTRMHSLARNDLANVVPALWRHLVQAEAILSISGTSTLHLQTAMDAALVSELLHVLLHREVVSVDAYDVSDASTFYNRVLDTLANWPSAYDNRRRGVETWNGRGLDAMDEDGRWAQDVRAPSTTSKGILAAHANDNFATFEHALHTLWALPSPTRCHLVVTNAERLFELADQSGPKAAKDNIASAMVDLSMRVRFISPLLRTVADCLRSLGGALPRSSSLQRRKPNSRQLGVCEWICQRCVSYRLPKRVRRCLIRLSSLTTRTDVLGLLCHGFRPALSVRAPLQASSNGSNGHLASDTQRSLFRSLASYCYDAVATTVPASDIVNTTGVLVEQLWQQWTERVVKGTGALHRSRDDERLMPEQHTLRRRPSSSLTSKTICLSY